MKNAFRRVVKFPIYFVDVTGIGESRGVFFKNFQKGAHLPFPHDTNQQGFVGVRVHAFRMQSGHAPSQLCHQLSRKVIGFVCYDLEFIAAFQPLKHEIDDEIGNKNIGEGGNDGICARLIDEKGKDDDGSVHGKRKPCDIFFGMKTLDERGDRKGSARRAETADHQGKSKARDYADADRGKDEIVSFLKTFGAPYGPVIRNSVFRMQGFEQHQQQGLKNEIHDQHNARFSADQNGGKDKDRDIQQEHENTHVYRDFAELFRGKCSEDRRDTRDAARGEPVIVGKIVERGGDEKRRREADQNIEKDCC